MEITYMEYLKEHAPVDHAEVARQFRDAGIITSVDGYLEIRRRVSNIDPTIAITRGELNRLMLTVRRERLGRQETEIHRSSHPTVLS